MFWKLSLLTSFAAVAFAGYSIVAGTENWGPSFFAAVLMFTVATTLLAGPYVVLGILAFLMRSHRALSATLFAVILLISVLGITLLSLETHAYLNRNKALPEATNLGIFFVGVVQCRRDGTSHKPLSIPFYRPTDLPHAPQTTSES